MGRLVGTFPLAGTMLTLAVMACNLPSVTPTLNAGETKIAATIYALQTDVPSSRIAAPVQDTSTPVQTNTVPPQVTSTPSAPLVIRDSLCWVGPGNVYEVVSSVKTGTQVKLLGRGSLSG